MTTKNEQSEPCCCADASCTYCHGNCTTDAAVRLYRLDTQDFSGLPFCDGCAADALGYGCFTTDPGEEPDDGVCVKCGEEFYNDCWGRPRCEVCDPPCPGCHDGGV